MYAFVGKMVMKKIFKEKNPSKPQEDPYYNKVPAKTMGFSHNKRERKPLPSGLSREEEKVLKKAKARAYALDMCFVSRGPIQLGWSSVIGLIPGFGDVIDLLLALFVYRTCCSVEPPLDTKVKGKMKLNLIIDFALGLVPILGDLADAAYKCNTKNVILLEDALVKRAKTRQGASGAGVQVGDAGAYDKYPGADQHGTVAPGRMPPASTSTKKPRRPEPAYDPSESEGRGGYFGGRAEVDLEVGEGIRPQQSILDRDATTRQHRGLQDRR